jgi:hypothetical protein
MIGGHCSAKWLLPERAPPSTSVSSRGAALPVCGWWAGAVCGSLAVAAPVDATFGGGPD